VLATFPDAFRQGAAARSKMPDPDFPRGLGLGDVGEGAPGKWILGGDATPPVHVLLSLYMRTAGGIEEASKLLEGQIAEHGATLISKHDAATFADKRVVHFNYVDGIAQPRFPGLHGRQYADMQPESQLGDFLLGGDYQNRYGGNYLGDIPSVLGTNATYGAFRIQRQDVFGFEEMLDSCAAAAGIDREAVAAKLMGRWRNGTPVSLSPDTPDPSPPLTDEELNDFDSVPGPGHRGLYDDTEGLRCPVGAHIRRMNPRGSKVMGMPHSRRILRRNMPFGPQIEPGQKRGENEPERGLMGYFMCGDLEMQFEFIQRVWVNQDIATSGLRDTREPIVGTQPEGGGQFRIPGANGHGPTVLRNLPNLVTTRGSVYCLLPGIRGLRYLAGLPVEGQAAAPAPAPAVAG
jgi:deferrochelatase/peroxidase EfeB